MFKLFKFSSKTNKMKGEKTKKTHYQNKALHQSEEEEPVGIIVYRSSGKLKKKYGI